jgi:tetratricopeptide (TPR) repeat protein
MLELILRVAGVGYPTSFFLPQQINGRRVFVENDRFGLRFFPPELARNPSPLVMPGQKPPGTIRIFVLGESAALGDPEPAFGFGRYLQALLQERFPNARFEVVNTGVTAINSHAILPIARECASHSGDVWVLYMGNNEFVGPFGPGTVFGSQVPPLSVIRFSLALKQTRLGQLISRLASRSSPQKGWGGMKMFLDHQVSPSDPRKEKVYEYFQANLEDILTAGRAAGAKVVVSTVAANLKDCPPFASQHSESLIEPRKTDWQQLFERAVQDQNRGDFVAAITNYQAAAQIDPSFAELHFRWAQCDLALTNLEEARLHFELARNLDTLPFRADTRLNTIIASSAKKHAGEGVKFVDGVATLARQTPLEIPGRELMYEHVHLNFDGNYWLARAVADSIVDLLPNAVRQEGRPDWASAHQCGARLGLTDWDRRRVYESLLRRMAEPPFVNQIYHADQMERLRQSVASLRARQTPEALEKARAMYHDALEAAPNDFYLRAGFAKLEEDANNLPAAIEQWRAVRDLIPFKPGPHFYLGQVLGRAGKTDEALDELNQALRIQPDLPAALEEEGKLLGRLNRFEEALTTLDRAGKLEPGNPRVYFDRAEVLAMAGRHPDAVDQLRQAVALQPGYWEAHYRLGVELAAEGDIRSAAEHFLETVKLNPNYYAGHLNLGVALAKLDKIEQAVGQFQETLRLDPHNQKAAEYLEALRATQSRRAVQR